MALTYWQDIQKALPEGVAKAILWSLGTTFAALLLFLFLRRKIMATPEQSRVSKGRAGVLGFSIMFVALLVSVRIWTWLVFKPAADSDLRTILENTLWTSGVAAVLYILVTAAQHALTKGTASIEIRHKVRLATSWTGIIVFLIVAAFIWVSGIKDFGLFLGIVGAGLALSLQETLVCIAGWLLLVVRRPFDIGDRIEIDGRIGDVIGVSVFQTSMLEVGNWVKADQSTGRMLIIPNSMLIRHALYNYTKGFPFVWNELTTTVTFESDWEEAEKLILDKAQVEAEKLEKEVQRQIRQMQSHYAIHYEQLSPIVYTTIAPNGVELTLRHLTPARARRATVHRISRDILRAVLEHPRIDLAYPTTRLYRNTDEGKPQMGGPSQRGSQ